MDTEGNPLHESYTETLSYGAEYQVVSPVESGYLADQLVVSGTMDKAEDVSITVTYTPTANR